MSDRPPACIASPITVPLNRARSVGRRMITRVAYGAPAAVPDRKYSSVMYGKSSTLAAAGTTLTGGFGYITPGAVTGPEIDGIDGVVRIAASNISVFIVFSFLPFPPVLPY